MGYFDSDDYDYEIELQKHTDAAKERLRSLSNEDLGKEWERECARHDDAVDRCEALNSPTIEDAQGWMDFIELVFKERGVNSFEFIFQD